MWWWLLAAVGGVATVAIVVNVINRNTIRKRTMEKFERAVKIVVDDVERTRGKVKLSALRGNGQRIGQMTMRGNRVSDDIYRGLSIRI